MADSLFAMMRAHPIFSLTAVRALECPAGRQSNCTRTLWYGQPPGSPDDEGFGLGGSLAAARTM